MGTTSPPELRRLETADARALADLSARFDDLQMVLRCCERLLTELAAEAVDDVVVEAVWTTALLSYGRCFAVGASDTALNEEDLTATQPHGKVLDWHRVLLQLRDHYGERTVNPRERFSVGVAVDDVGMGAGIGITSIPQPLVDSVTVRQAGAIAYALSARVNERITAQQEKVFGEVRDTAAADLAKLGRLDVTEPS